MGKMDDLMFPVWVCETYGWTYQEYLEQPVWFIHLIREKLVRDNKEREMQIKKMNRGR
jgi:hypothetical protein